MYGSRQVVPTRPQYVGNTPKMQLATCYDTPLSVFHDFGKMNPSQSAAQATLQASQTASSIHVYSTNRARRSLDGRIDNRMRSSVGQSSGVRGGPSQQQIVPYQTNGLDRPVGVRAGALYFPRGSVQSVGGSNVPMATGGLIPAPQAGQPVFSAYHEGGLSSTDFQPLVPGRTGAEGINSQTHGGGTYRRTSCFAASGVPMDVPTYSNPSNLDNRLFMNRA